MSNETGNALISIGEVTIPFYEDRLVVQLGEDGEIYVAIRPIVEALGLSWGSQLNRIKRDAVLSKKVRTLSVFITNTQGQGASQHREVVCLPKQYVSGFLFGISAGRIKDLKLKAKVIQFQEEVHLFLDAAFTGDAESAMEAIRQKYLRQGYDEAWIKQRQITIETRNQLTDEWKSRGVQHGQYGILTAVIHRGAFDMNPSDHKRYKGVEKGEVRDHMTGLELAFINVAEQATIANVQSDDAQGYEENYDAAEKGGRSAGVARRAFEKEHGRKVISAQSYIEQRKKLQAGEEEVDKD
ncbi:MAG: phage antirepressor N-terminal domain-containing protein [Chloroflexi bacterium]|nr:phage antirepressor N-terminal domain-containing protein [Chloroflexota bacterium]MCI0728585.1 phage antirepressor N-terminal domain-containing protein [Chloroflexota bacterium]